MIELIQGFKVGSTDPIDERLVIDSSNLDPETGGRDVDVMPEKYFAVNKDDGIIYVYDRETNSFTKASDFINESHIQYYKRESEPDDKEQERLLTIIDEPASPDGDPISLIDEDSGGIYTNYKREVLDAGEIVRRSGLALKFEHDSEYYTLRGILLDKDNNEIAVSNKIDIPVEDAFDKASLSENNKKLILTKIHGEVVEIDLQPMYDSFEIVNKTDLQNEIDRANAAEEQLNNDIIAEAAQARRIEGALEDLKTPGEKVNLVSAINAEYDRANDAEEGLRSLIRGEIDERLSADSNLEEKLSNELLKEKTARENAVTTLTNNLNAENERATKAENSLDGRLDVIEGEATVDGSIKKALSDAKKYTDVEESRALEAEKLLRENVTQEITDRIEANTEIKEALALEEKRATNKESEIAGNLIDEINRAKEVESSLKTNVTNEITNRENAINQVTASISEETARAIKSEGNLNTALTDEINRATKAEENITAELNEEISTARTNEAANKTAIETEVSRAKGVEGNLTNLRTLTKTSLVDAINSESTSREGDVNLLTNNLDTEISDRKNAISALETTVKNEILTARANEAANKTAIDTQAGNLEDLRQSIPESASYTNKLATQEDIANEKNRATKAEETLSTNLETLNTNLTIEISNREAAVKTEKERAEGIEAKLREDLNKEISDRGTADTDLGNRVSAIEEKIPTEASKDNNLADKAYVDDAVSKSAAIFKGTFESTEAIEAVEGDANDYLFYKHTEDQNVVYDRYKYSPATNETSPVERIGNWLFEYRINNSSFTTAQWSAIDSGATTELINKISVNESNITGLKSTKANATDVNGHIENKNNPHSVTKAQLDLGNVDNTSDLNKPISTATQTALDLKADKADVTNELAKKQDVISDLSTIRSGAEKGATAVQSADMATAIDAATEDMATQTWVEGKNYLTEHQSLANYRTSADQNDIDKGITDRLDVIEGKESEWDAKATEEYVTTAVSGKQDTITDLETIRSNSKLGASAVQPSAINDMATQTWVGEQGYLKEHQDLSAYRTSAAQDEIDNGIKKLILPTLPTDTTKDYTLEYIQGTLTWVEKTTQ